MKIEITNTELAKAVNLPISKARRNSKEFLPPDPQATRRSGYTKKFSMDDAFKVYIGTHLVSSLGYSFHEARAIITDLWPWAESVDLLPGPPVKRKGIDKNVRTFEVRIFQKDGEFFYYVYGSERHITESGNDETRGNYQRISKRTYLYTIGSHAGEYPEYQIHVQTPEFLSSKLLQFQTLLHMFLNATGTREKWGAARGYSY